MGMAVRVGINGFGRIGRGVLRCAIDHADNDLTALPWAELGVDIVRPPFPSRHSR